MNNRIVEADKSTWPQVGETWVDGEGGYHGPLVATENGKFSLREKSGSRTYTANGRYIGENVSDPLDLIERVKVEPHPFPEEPKPPKEVFWNAYTDRDGDLMMGSWFLTEGEADRTHVGRFAGGDRLTGHAIRYVLPDEAGLTFSEEERRIGWLTLKDKLMRGDASEFAFIAALAAIAQHRSKRP